MGWRGQVQISKVAGYKILLKRKFIMSSELREKIKLDVWNFVVKINDLREFSYEFLYHTNP